MCVREGERESGEREGEKESKKGEGSVLFNDALNTFMIILHL